MTIPVAGAVAAEVVGGAAEGAAAGEAAAGAGEAGAWGEEAAAGEGEGERFTQKTDLGHGNHLDLDPAMWQALLHDPAVVAAITDRANAMCAAANSMAVTPGAQYVVTVQNRSNTTRARARVRPGGDDPYKAMVDDAVHSTLLKVMDQYPSDPKPETSAPEPDQGDTGAEAGGMAASEVPAVESMEGIAVIA